MALYYFECPIGCGLRDARNIGHAQRSITIEVGTHNRPTLVREASDENIRWVASMGGWVPDNHRRRLGLPHKGRLIR
jgi:hypothetical protein